MGTVSSVLGGPISSCSTDSILQRKPGSSDEWECTTPTSLPPPQWIEVSKGLWVPAPAFPTYEPLQPSQCRGGSLLVNGRCVLPCDDGYELDMLSTTTTSNKCRIIVPSTLAQVYGFLVWNAEGELVTDGNLRNVDSSSSPSEISPFALLPDTFDNVYLVSKTDADKPTNPFDTQWFTTSYAAPISEADFVAQVGEKRAQSVRAAYSLPNLNGHLWYLRKRSQPVKSVDPAGLSESTEYTVVDAYGRRNRAKCTVGYSKVGDKCIRDATAELTCPVGFKLNSDKTACVIDTKTEPVRQQLALWARIVGIVLIAIVAALGVRRLVAK